MKTVAAYVPALHEGYRTFFEKCARAGARTLYIFPYALIAEVDHLRKDLRALDPDYAAASIRAWRMFDEVLTLTNTNIRHLIVASAEIVMPDEEISRHVGEKYFAGCPILYDNVFLRRDKSRASAKEPIIPNRTILSDSSEIMAWAALEGEKSPDWWRHVGGILVKEGNVILVAHNCHLPNENAPGMLGDYRSNFTKGVAIELTTAEHVESVLVGTASRRGIVTDGTSLYLTDFPCPPCAKLVARAGIRKLYYGTPSYSMVETEENLRAAGVEIVFVQMQ